MNYQPNDSGGWKPVPDNKIFVIDLKATPPALIATVEVGKQPSGMAINKAASLVLVANRADNAVTVLTISGKEVKPVQTGRPRRHRLGGRHHAGRQACARHQACRHKVAWLDIDGQTVSYNKKDIAVGSWPYNVQITFDGHFALTANQGNNGVGDGGAARSASST